MYIREYNVVVLTDMKCVSVKQNLLFCALELLKRIFHPLETWSFCKHFNSDQKCLPSFEICLLGIV